jgi:hypothetical protein
MRAKHTSTVSARGTFGFSGGGSSPSAGGLATGPGTRFSSRSCNVRQPTGYLIRSQLSACFVQADTHARVRTRHDGTTLRAPSKATAATPSRKMRPRVSVSIRHWAVDTTASAGASGSAAPAAGLLKSRVADFSDLRAITGRGRCTGPPDLAAAASGADPAEEKALPGPTRAPRGGPPSVHWHVRSACSSTPGDRLVGFPSVCKGVLATCRHR